MVNRRMEEKLAQGEAVDLSTRERTPDGDFVLTEADVARIGSVEGVDLCDASREAWIWSAGRMPDGRCLASTSSKFYGAEGVECIWLR